MDKKRTAVLIHGYNVNEPDWEWVVWGKPQDGILGRAARGLEIACANDADLLYIGGGGSHKDGKSEAEVTYVYMRDNLDQLVAQNVCNEGDAGHMLLERVHIDKRSRNTFEEIVNFMNVCYRRDIMRLILVSSPFHGPRCQKIGDTVRMVEPNIKLRVATITADTDPKEQSVSRVAVVEPRHWLNSHVHHILHDIPKELHSEVSKELEALIAKYTPTRAAQCRPFLFSHRMI